MPPITPDEAGSAGGGPGGQTAVHNALTRRVVVAIKAVVQSPWFTLIAMTAVVMGLMYTLQTVDVATFIMLGSALTLIMLASFIFASIIYFFKRRRSQQREGQQGSRAEGDKEELPPLEVLPAVPDGLQVIGDGECVVCLDTTASLAFVPCGHACMCSACYAMCSLRSCPLCRAEATQLCNVKAPEAADVSDAETGIDFIDPESQNLEPRADEQDLAVQASGDSCRPRAADSIYCGSGNEHSFSGPGTGDEQQQPSTPAPESENQEEGPEDEAHCIEPAPAGEGCTLTSVVISDE